MTFIDDIVISERLCYSKSERLCHKHAQTHALTLHTHDNSLGKCLIILKGDHTEPTLKVAGPDAKKVEGGGE